jgi:hypothetical protein
MALRRRKPLRHRRRVARVGDPDVAVHVGPVLDAVHDDHLQPHPRVELHADAKEPLLLLPAEQRRRCAGDDGLPAAEARPYLHRALARLPHPREVRVPEPLAAVERDGLQPPVQHGLLPVRVADAHADGEVVPQPGAVVGEVEAGELRGVDVGLEAAGLVDEPEHQRHDAEGDEHERERAEGAAEERVRVAGRWPVDAGGGTRCCAGRDGRAVVGLIEMVDLVLVVVAGGHGHLQLLIDEQVLLMIRSAIFMFM